MLKVLLIIGAVIVLAVAVLLALAASRPDTFRYSRSIVVNAPPEKIFPLIDSYAAWRAWSPYEDKDPGMKRTYRGPASGVGAGYAWEGEPKKVGSGSMETLESTPPSKVKIKLDFTVPFEAHNTAEFTLEPAGGGATTVTWAMYGPNPFISRLMGMVFNMDKMIGADFERGLQRLKTQAESST